MQLEAAVAGPQIEFMPFDVRHRARYGAIEGQFDFACGVDRISKAKFPFADRQGRRSSAIMQRHLVLGALAVTEGKRPLPSTDRHPAEGSPR